MDLQEAHKEIHRLKRLLWKMEDILNESRDISITSDQMTGREEVFKIAHIKGSELKAYQRVEKLIRRANQ